jgi:hypothetical protein
MACMTIPGCQRWDREGAMIPSSVGGRGEGKETRRQECKREQRSVAQSPMTMGSVNRGEGGR